MKKIAALFLALMMMATVFAVLAEDVPTLTMVTNAEFPPYEYIDSTDPIVEGSDVTGIDAEIAKAVCDKLGYKLVIKDMPFDPLINEVATGKADFAMAGLTITPEREKNVLFSIPYATGVQAIIVKEGSPITTVDDLFDDGAAYTIGVQLSTTGDIFASDDFGEDRVFQFESGNQAVLALLNGKIDCVIIDNEPAKAYVSVNEGLMVLKTTYVEESYAACFGPKNTELQAKFNAALEELINDGTIAEIIAKYIKAE